MKDKSIKEKNILIFSITLICAIFSVPLFFNWYQLYASYQIANFTSSQEIKGIEFAKYYNQILIELARTDSPNAETRNTSYQKLKELGEKSDFYHDLIFKKLTFGSEVETQRALFLSYAAETHAYILQIGSNNDHDDESQDKLAEITYRYLKLVGDYSNLILDPELESYYLAYLATSQIPQLSIALMKLTNSVRSNSSHSTIEKRQEILRQCQVVRTILEDIQYATIKSSEAANIKGFSDFRFEILEKFDNLRTTIRPAISNIEFRTNYNDAVSAHQNNSIEELMEIIPVLTKFTDHSFYHLVEMLKSRLSTTKEKQLSSILLSFSLWAASLVLALWMFFRIWGRRQELGLIIQTQQASLESSAKMAALGEIAAGIGHEIATPLTIISSSSSNLVRQSANATENKELILKTDEKIQRMVKRINQIIRSMKSFVYQNESQEDSLFDLRTILDDVVLLTHSKALKIGLQIEIECPSEPLYVFGVESELIQVLVNLISNSIDALETEEKRELKVLVSAAGSEIKILVQDSGPGIPKEIAKKIFEALFTTKEPGKGTGLGLSISKKIMEKHKGDLRLLDKSPGTTFQITLPLAQNPQPAN